MVHRSGTPLSRRPTRPASVLPESASSRPDPVEVLYIVGASRTGSTIIANILGQLDGCVAVGELWNLWRRGLLERRMCGCGVPVPECPVWGQVLGRTFPDGLPDAEEARRIDELARRRLKARNIGFALAGSGRPPELDRDDYRQLLTRLYSAVRDVTGARVVVDSSKGPAYALILASLPNVRLTVVNVVRDPRAVAFSSQRRVPLRDFGDERLMQRVPAWVGARRWLKWQGITDSVLRLRLPQVHRVRYEDFTRDPRRVIGHIARLVGDESALPFLDEHSVRLAATHSVAGNPRRFQTGAVAIRTDDEWHTAMRPKEKAAITGLTLPLLLLHGYPVLPGAPREPAGRGR